jgi:hypothetical protein
MEPKDRPSKYQSEATMNDRILDERRAALEDAFFAKQDDILLRQLRKADAAKLTKAALSAASGIRDDAVLEKLITLKVGSDTLAALSLVPLVAVAWADGSIDDNERRVAFSCAVQEGLAKQDVGYKLFECWLAEPPSPALLAAWKGYVVAFSATLGHEARAAFKSEILDRARTVAEAAGGFFGIGRKISPPEERVLKELERELS